MWHSVLSDPSLMPSHHSWFQQPALFPLCLCKHGLGKDFSKTLETRSVSMTVPVSSAHISLAVAPESACLRSGNGNDSWRVCRPTARENSAFMKHEALNQPHLQLAAVCRAWCHCSAMREASFSAFIQSFVVEAWELPSRTSGFASTKPLYGLFIRLLGFFPWMTAIR